MSAPLMAGLPEAVEIFALASLAFRVVPVVVAAAAAPAPVAAADSAVLASLWSALAIGVSAVAAVSDAAAAMVCLTNEPPSLRAVQF